MLKYCLICCKIAGPANRTLIRSVSGVDGDESGDEDTCDAFFCHEPSSTLSKCVQPLPETHPCKENVPRIPAPRQGKEVDCKSENPAVKDWTDFLSQSGVKIRRKDKSKDVAKIYEERDVSTQQGAALGQDSEFKPPKMYVSMVNFKANKALITSYVSKFSEKYNVVSNLSESSEIANECPKEDVTYLIPLVLKAKEPESNKNNKHALLVVISNRESFHIVDSRDYRKNPKQRARVRKAVKIQLDRMLPYNVMLGNILVPKSSKKGFCASYTWLNCLAYALFDGKLPDPICRPEMDDESVNLLMAVKLYQLYRTKSEVCYYLLHCQCTNGTGNLE